MVDDEGIEFHEIAFNLVRLRFAREVGWGCIQNPAGAWDLVLHVVSVSRDEREEPRVDQFIISGTDYLRNLGALEKAGSKMHENVERDQGGARGGERGG